MEREREGEGEGGKEEGKKKREREREKRTISTYCFRALSWLVAELFPLTEIILQ